MSAPGPEDAKILTLARVARTRAYTLPVDADGPDGADRAQGAAVRDTDGRTYAAATVEHPDRALATSALRGALAAAYSSGARSFEAAALVSAGPVLDDADRALLAGLAPGVPVWLAGPDGVPVGPPVQP